ncbi:uncharacterized protein LOC130908996 [Corythoichthys intestinalis]|uniref:uncharacterized protein LOC130908996 n=1 Tax=Corythoichthys intestinalis TaxID=161448 RepID=UPI0025A65722|nr:uncharacterized protein LOC130908996 [Corythoichthys intestinalis]
MAEEDTLPELEDLEKQLQSLVNLYSSDELRADSKTFCSNLCKLVEEYTSRWKTPLPRLRILETALCYFARGSSSFTSSCDHVLHTLSSLALSVYEVLLFFDEQDFHKEPLKHFSVKFQECNIALARHQNVHLLQVEPIIRGGGAWVSRTLKEILSESSLPQNEVDRFLSSEPPVFLALRVRYLISRERVSEALALAKCCIRHPTAGKHLFFLQVYLTWLYKTQRHQLLQEVSCLNGKDAVHIICSLEYEETNELLLALCQMFLSQQLCRGEMYYLWELIFVWSKLHDRVNTSKQAFLEESRRLMLSATNINSIFPFIKVLIQELGEEGIQFCVELCANALKSCLPGDTTTKSLIYKTIAGLLPNDLEVCRACALLVFFLERTVEAYKMVYLLYMLPDQDYHVEHIPIRNQIRFETLQVLKKDLYFDPEFWNLIALQTNCLKLISEKVVDAALEELMEETWIANYCAKEFSFVYSTSTGEDDKRTVKKPHHNDGRQKEMNSGESPQKLKLGQGKTDLNDSNAVKKKGTHRSRFTKEASAQPLRRSFWQVDRIHDITSGQLRRVTRLSEKDPPKRKIQKPKWLLEDSGGLQDSKFRRRGLRDQKGGALKRSEFGHIKNNTQPKVSKNLSTKHEKGFPLDSVEPASAPQVILELSLPDNELSGMFNEDCNRQKMCPPMLFYKPTLKIPENSPPMKVLQGKEVILRARDATTLVQLLHCYARRPKGKGNGPNTHGSVSTITRSSAHASPPKEPQGGLCEKPNAETKGGLNSEEAVATKHPEPSNTVLQLSAKECLEKIVEGVLSDKSVKGTETKTLGEAAPSLSTNEVHSTVKSIELCSTSQSPAVEEVIQQQTTASIEFSQTQSSQIQVTEHTSPVASTLTSQNPDSPFKVPLPSTRALNIDEEQHPKPLPSHSQIDTCIEKTKGVTSLGQAEKSNDTNGNSELVTETFTHVPPVEIPQDMVNPEQPADTKTNESVLPDKSRVANVSSHTFPEAATPAYIEGNDQRSPTEDDDFEDGELIETEESKLESCCTFCQREFKGRRVVIHAMFHFRKDECMFCGTIFKDDLLAMMHLSDHIEKLKRSKELASNKAQQSGVSVTKDFSHPKTSAKAKAPDWLSGNHINRRPRKSSICKKLISQPEPHSQSESRNLRSNDKAVDGPLVQGNKQNDRKYSDRKVNGNIGKTQFDQMKRTNSKAAHEQTQMPNVNKDDAGNGKMNHVMLTSCGSFASSAQKRKHIELTHMPNINKDKAGNGKVNHVMPKSCDSFASSVQKRKRIEYSKEDVIIDTKKVSQKKVCCPADGCSWSTDLSKNRVALLYHALEHHYGDTKPLKLSLKVANNKCSICMRVLWSFEHFQHHVERHRLSPRHPCLHLGCTARFKTGNEMRRHARKHSPLQAVCCLPGCSELFICLWALNLHEKEHYASKLTKPVKTVDAQTDNKPISIQVKTVTSSVKGTLSESTRKLRGHVSQDSTSKIVSDSLHPTEKSVGKEEQKVKNESKNSNVLKNLSNKDPTTQSNKCSLNLRLRKAQTSKTNLVATKLLQAPFFKCKAKLRDNCKKKQVSVTRTEIVPKRRGRPRKYKKEEHDKVTTKVQNNQCLKSKPPDCPSVSNKVKIKEKPKHSNNAGCISEMPDSKSKSKKSVSENRSNCVEKKMSLNRDSHSRKASPGTIAPAHRLGAHNLKKRCASKEGDTFGANIAKKNRVTPRRSPRRQSGLPAASKEPAKSAFTVVRRYKTHSSQGSPADCVPAATAVNMQKMITNNNKSEKRFHGKNKVGVTICPNDENMLRGELSNMSMDGTSSTTSELNMESSEQSSNVTSGGSSSNMSELNKGSKKEPSNGTMGGSSSTTSKLNKESKKEPSHVTMDDTSFTTFELNEESNEESSNVTMGGSSSNTSDLNKESKEEPSNVTMNGSSSTTSELKKKLNEKPSKMTMDGSCSITSELRKESKEEPSNVNIEDSSSIKWTEESKKKPSHVTSDDSSSTLCNLKRKSIEEPSNMTSIGFSSTTRKSQEPSNVTGDGTSSIVTKLKGESMTEHSNVTSDGSGFFTLKLKSETKKELSNMTSNGSNSTMSNMKRKSKRQPSNMTSNGSSFSTLKLKSQSKKEPSNKTSVGSRSTKSNLKRKFKREHSKRKSSGSSCSTLKLKRQSKKEPNMTKDGSSSTTSNLKRKSKKGPSNVTSENSCSTQSKLKKKSHNKPLNVTSDDPSSTKSKLKRKSTKVPLNVTSDGPDSATPTSQAGETARGRTKLKIACVGKTNAAQTVKEGTKKAKKTKKSPHPVENIAIQVATDVPYCSQVKAGQVDNCADEQGHVNKTPDYSKHPLSLKSTSAQEEDKFTLCIDTLAEYGKKHMRAPPTAYLNEWFTAMPKRRKVAGFLASTSQQETLVTTRPQRQRCANCFTTFNSAEELQSHLQVQRCSNLFGFDSDDEGNS